VHVQGMPVQGENALLELQPPVSHGVQVMAAPNCPDAGVCKCTCGDCKKNKHCKYHIMKCHLECTP